MADAADSADVQLGAGVAAPAALSAADIGAWQVLPFHSEVLAVHAALLPSGDVLFAAGSGNSLTRFQSPDFGDVAKKIGSAWSGTRRSARRLATTPASFTLLHLTTGPGRCSTSSAAGRRLFLTAG
jgi:hypothetical protein